MTVKATGRRRNRMLLVGLSSLLLGGLCCRTVAAADWATYRADIARSGITADGLGNDLALCWTYRPMAPPRPAWPPPAEELPRVHADNAFHVAIADGVVYFGSSVTNKVCAVDAATGAVRWTFVAEGPVRFAPTVAAGRVYFGADDGLVYCLDAANGSLLWKHRGGPSAEKVLGNGRMISLWPVRTGVLVDQGIAYYTAGVFPYEGLYIGALRANDGSVVWKNDTVGDRAHELEFGGISPHGYLLASSRALFVPSGRAMPAAFDRSDGKFLFATAPGGKRGGTWALLDKNRLIAGVDKSGTPDKAAYDARSGRPLGEAFAWFQGIDMVVTPKMVYLVTPAGAYAVDRQTYGRAIGQAKTLAAERQELGRQLATLKKRQADAGDSAKNKNLRDQIESLAKKIGSITAKQKQLRGSVYRWHHGDKDLVSVIRAGGTVVTGGKGLVLGLDADRGRELWRHKVDGHAVGLAVSGGRLVVSTNTGYVYCFGPPATAPPKTIAAPRVANPYGDGEWTTKYRAAAHKIIEDSGINKGYCLVLDCGQGQLAYELARGTELRIVGLEKDPAQRAVARSRLEAAGLLGARVVVEPWDLKTLPDYFANLIVSDGMLRTGKTSAAGAQVQRVLRPWGGIAYVSFRADGKAEWKRVERGPLPDAGAWTQQYANSHNTACSGDRLVNGPLGVLWFGEPGPLGMVERHGRAEAPVAMDGRLFVEGEGFVMAIDAFNGTTLWKREIPGAVRVKIQADSGNLALTKTGLYVAVYDKCYRLDPVTGKTIRVYDMPATDGGAPRRWGYIAVADNILYGSAAQPMRQEYGALLKAYLRTGQWKAPKGLPPAYADAFARFVKQYKDPAAARMAAERSGMLYRFMTSFGPGGEFTQKNAVTNGLMTSDKVFAIDTETGKVLWTHDGKKIANVTLVLGAGKIFFADRAVTAAERREALAQRRKLIAHGIYKVRPGIVAELHAKQRLRALYAKQKAALVKAKLDHRRLDVLIYQTDYLIESLKAELFKEETPEGSLTYADADVRLVVALDARTGTKAWMKPVDLTGCCGDRLGAAYSDGLLLLFGNFGNHDAWRFREGGLKWRRITTLAADTGAMVWSRPLGYRTRPLIVGDKIIVEPRACYLRTGAIVMRDHPVTGRQVPWEFLRPGHTCGITAASAEGLFYRSACTAFYDLARDRGVTLFGGYRPGCAISVIPACGLLLSPEASAGCTCSYPIRGSVALKRKRGRAQPWTVFVTPGDLTPVRQLAVNLGAFSDMKDAAGTVWFAYPNPRTAHYTHFPNYGVKLNLKTKILPGMGYFSHDFKDRTIAGTDRPWLFTSGCRGLLRCELPLRGAKDSGSDDAYTVRLGFAAPAGDRPGQRVFAIKLQGKVVDKDCDIVRLAGGTGKALVKEYRGISVKDALALELVPNGRQPSEQTAPVINFVEVQREK